MTADELRAVFDAPEPLTVGLEEELLLLDPGTLDLVHRAADVHATVAGDPRFKLELPASQLEILTAPERNVPAAMATLAAARRDLASAAAGLALPAGAGVHPFAAPEGLLNAGERYDRIEAEYGRIARRQLVCSLQVHVAVGGAERTLAVYNALRSYLPELAALAANAPFHAGEDSGLASVRPTIAEQLPRQGMPPAIASWDEFAAALAWGARAGAVPEPRRWWWELRPHAAFGTLEIRVPDAQAAPADAAGVAAFAHSLVAWLADRHDGGEPLAVAPTWRIEENRWAACRHGVEGELADLETGERQPTRARLHALLDALGPVAARIGCAEELGEARRLTERNGAIAQRAAGGPYAAAQWLAGAWLGVSGETAGVAGPGDAG